MFVHNHRKYGDIYLDIQKYVSSCLINALRDENLLLSALPKEAWVPSRLTPPELIMHQLIRSATQRRVRVRLCGPGPSSRHRRFHFSGVVFVANFLSFLLLIFGFHQISQHGQKGGRGDYQNCEEDG